MYNSRKWQFSALEDSMYDDDLFLFRSCFDDVMINPIILIVNAIDVKEPVWTCVIIVGSHE